MAKLKPGAVIIDLPTKGIYGDLDHCPAEDLLESADALLSLMPKVGHKGLWGLSKDFDSGSYVYTQKQGYKPPEGIELERDIHRGPSGLTRINRPFSLVPIVVRREHYWKQYWYTTLVGSVADGRASPDMRGITDLTIPAKLERFEREQAIEADAARRRPWKQESMSL